MAQFDDQVNEDSKPKVISGLKPVERAKNAKTVYSWHTISWSTNHNQPFLNPSVATLASPTFDSLLQMINSIPRRGEAMFARPKCGQNSPKPYATPYSPEFGQNIHPMPSASIASFALHFFSISSMSRSAPGTRCGSELSFRDGCTKYRPAAVGDATQARTVT